MTDDQALVLDSLLSEKVEVPADIDAGSLGDWFNREFVEELLKASLAALGEHLDRPTAADLSLVLVRMFCSGFVSGYHEALHPEDAGVCTIGNRDTG